MLADETTRLLDVVGERLRQYVVLAAPQRDALTAFVLHTWAYDAAEATAYVLISSAERESGKTRLLEILSLYVAEPWLTGRVTAAVLMRKIDRDRPTLLLDESDSADDARQPSWRPRSSCSRRA